MPQKLTAEIIVAAIEGFESQKRRIDSRIDELRQLLDGDRTESATTSVSPARKRKVSAAGRRKMAAAQKARWARIKAEAEPASSPAAAKPEKQKRKLSAAGRKAISEQSTVAKKAAAKKTAGKRPHKKAQRAPEAAATTVAQ